MITSIIVSLALVSGALVKSPQQDILQQNGRFNQGTSLPRCTVKDKAILNEYKKAQLLQEQGKDNQALEKLKKIITREPTFCDAFEAIGDIHEKNRRFDEAVAWYKKCLTSRPDNPPVHRKIAESYLLIGDTTAALFHYEHMIRLDARNPQGYQAAGRIYYLKGYPSTALHFLRQAVVLYGPEKRGDAEGVRLTMGMCFYQLGECDSVIVYLEQKGLLEHPLSFRALSDCYSQKGDQTRSEYYLNEADQIQGVEPLQIKLR
jgi:tetratricopeptide (TPR) repeat protein